MTKIILEEFVYELMNNSVFTDFLTVSTGNIDAGFDIQHVYQTYSGEDSWEGQTQILTVLQQLSTGHSIFYQREGVFYYKSIEATAATIKTFDKTKIIKFESATDGKNKVFERLYWTDSALKWESPVNDYNVSRTFDIKAIRDTADIEGILANIGTRTGSAKQSYTLEIPIYPNLYILDKIQVEAGKYFPGGAFILDVSVLDVDILTNPEGAVGVDDFSFWKINDITHNYNSCTTRMLVEQTTDV